MAQQGLPVVCDMSSDFMTGPIDWDKYHAVYADAGLNIGPAKMTIVIVR